MMKLKNLITLLTTAILTSTFFTGCSNNNSGINGTINVYNCADYIDESLISKFEDETGIKVIYDKYDTNEIMYQKIQTSPGVYDLVFPSDYMVEKMRKEGLLEKLNFNNIPNYKYISDDFLNLSYDPTNEYSVPYMWGTIGILYDSTVITEPVTSWDILWDEKYKDNIYMFDSLRDSLAIALIKNGYSLNSTNPDEINVAKEDLIKQKKLTSPVYLLDEIKDNMIKLDGASSLLYDPRVSQNMKIETVIIDNNREIMPIYKEVMPNVFILYSYEKPSNIIGFYDKNKNKCYPVITNIIINYNYIIST